MPLEDPLLKLLDLVKPTTSKAILESELIEAYKKSMDAGSITGASPDDIIINLANDISFAINKYFITADVTTEVTVGTGQPDSGGGMSDNEGTGEGIGTITTEGKVTKKEDDDKGAITKYLGEGRFEVSFKKAGIQEISDAEIKLEIEV